MDLLNQSQNSTKKVVIVGGGLTGALNACFFAKRGWRVELYEFRTDIRKTTHFPGRSINLALSHRGREALKAVDCEDLVLEHAIPMYGRYVHDQNGKSYNIQKYGLKNEYICSIGRRILNEILLSHVDKLPTVQLNFNHKLKSYNREHRVLTFINLERNEEVRVENADLICGCDGAFSALRRSFLQMQDFNYSQNYISHRYLELCIKPNSKEEFQMPPNYFHLWPRGSFCLIGLANQDKTFTVTLLAPKSIFDEMGGNTEKFLQFFEKYFPDAYRLIGRKNIEEVFSKQKPSYLLSVKSDPHHMDDNVVLLGDAAHAMVPFYGQGMNAGFEDCLVLHETLDEYKENVAESLKAYSKLRCIDSHAICDLAMYNYEELRDLVNHWSFKFRKFFDFIMYRLFPSRYIPLYNMVTFTRIRYHQVIEERKKQDNFVQRLKKISIFVVLAAGMAAAAFALKDFNFDTCNMTLF